MCLFFGRVAFFYLALVYGDQVTIIGNLRRMMAAELQELFPFVRALATNLDNTIKLKDNTIKGPKWDGLFTFCISQTKTKYEQVLG